MRCALNWIPGRGLAKTHQRLTIKRLQIMFVIQSVLWFWAALLHSGQTAGDTKAEPSQLRNRHQNIGLEMLTFKLTKASGCHSTCVSEAEQFRFSIFKLPFRGLNMLANERPYSRNPLVFWIDECLRFRYYCMEVADVWWTDDEGPGVAPVHDNESESVERVTKAWYNRAAACTWKVAPSPRSEREPTCPTNLLSKRTCMCRVIIVIDEARVFPPKFKKPLGNPASTDKPPWQKTRSVSTEKTKDGLEDASFCNLHAICKRLSSRMFQKAKNDWFCRQGFPIIEDPRAGVGSEASGTNMCACAKNPRTQKGPWWDKRTAPCYTKSQIYESMKQAKLIPVGETVWTSHELPEPFSNHFFPQSGPSQDETTTSSGSILKTPTARSEFLGSYGSLLDDLPRQSLSNDLAPNGGHTFLDVPGSVNEGHISPLTDISATATRQSSFELSNGGSSEEERELSIRECQHTLPLVGTTTTQNAASVCNVATIPFKNSMEIGGGENIAEFRNCNDQSQAGNVDIDQMSNALCERSTSSTAHESHPFSKVAAAETNSAIEFTGGVNLAELDDLINMFKADELNIDELLSDDLTIEDIKAKQVSHSSAHSAQNDGNRNRKRKENWGFNMLEPSEQVKKLKEVCDTPEGEALAGSQNLQTGVAMQTQGMQGPLASLDQSLHSQNAVNEFLTGTAVGDEAFWEGLGGFV